ncbi:hypothetical protein BGX31_005557 [Mortierella sp. GBA43]|nr:hypothetical protein BGX31_005557 [Mortierella sp. GBA43]
MASEFRPAEASTPQLKVHQRTFRFMDQQLVYIQVIEMINSAWIWVSSPGSSFQQGNGGGVAVGSGGPSGAEGSSMAAGTFGDFAMAMPVSRPGQPSVSSTLLGNPLEETAASMARRLATKFKMQFLVNVDVPPGVENQMMLAFAEKKVVETVQSILASASDTPALAASASTLVSTSA